MAKANRSVAALNAAVAAAALTGGPVNGGDVAVLEKPKTVRKPRAKEVIEQASVANKASPRKQAEVAGVAEAEVIALESIRKLSVNLRDPSVKPEQRRVAMSSAVSILIGVGLGERSKGYGPFVRSVVLRMTGGMLGIKTVSRDRITAPDVIRVMESPKFQAEASKALESYIGGLKPNPGDVTAKARLKGAERAKAWIDAGLQETYVTALRVIMATGAQVNFTTDKGTISMPIDRALGVAFGRSITASELAKAGEKTVTKA